jgi:hypothetical protein
MTQIEDVLEKSDEKNNWTYETGRKREEKN